MVFPKMRNIIMNKYMVALPVGVLITVALYAMINYGSILATTI